MGIIKGIFKLLLSNLFILSLLIFVLASAFHSSLSPEYFKAQTKGFLKDTPGFQSSIGQVYNYSQIYFFNLNKTEEIVPEDLNLPFKLSITKQDASVTKEEFENAIFEKLADSMYNQEQETPLGRMSIASMDKKVNGYKKISIILSVIFGLALFLLFSGRFVLLGIDFLVTSIFYFPFKFIFYIIGKRAVESLPAGAEATAGVQNFLGGVLLNSLSVATTYFFYFLVAGVAFVVIGILVKILRIGLWFQSFFEKKENRMKVKK